jgi:two-component system LytT family response regulator
VTIQAYVVDDERLAVQRLTRLLGETGRVEIAGSTIDPEEALVFLNAQPVDVLFLDIQMPGLTGFELLEQLARPPVVVFTTAYDAYALSAFETNAVDYLLKPIEIERLQRALDRVERVRGQPAPDVRSLARELAAQLSPARKLERIASRVGERTTLLEVARVTHFLAKDKLTFAVVNGREHVVDFTLAQLEERLDSRRFVRIHRATIVNVTFIQELYPEVDGALRAAPGASSEARGGVLVRLKDEVKSELSVARDRVRDLKARLGI